MIDEFIFELVAEHLQWADGRSTIFMDFLERSKSHQVRI